MTFYICSCGMLFGERKEAFDQCCKLKGHTLFEVSAGLYSVVYALYEDNTVLKERVHKRNQYIAKLKKRLQKNVSELNMLKAI